jgi:hypothetical protein
MRVNRGYSRDLSDEERVYSPLDRPRSPLVSGAVFDLLLLVRWSALMVRPSRKIRQLPSNPFKRYSDENFGDFRRRSLVLESWGQFARSAGKRASAGDADTRGGGSCRGNSKVAATKTVNRREELAKQKKVELCGIEGCRRSRETSVRSGVVGIAALHGLKPESVTLPALAALACKGKGLLFLLPASDTIPANTKSFLQLAVRPTSQSRRHG